MKKNRSFLEFFARSSFPAVMGLLLVGAGVQFLLFKGAFHPENMAYEVFAASRISFVFYVVFLLITAVISLPGCGFTSRVGYTMNRLGMSETRVFLLQSLYNFMVYVIVMAAEVFTVLGLIAYYKASVPPAFWGPQEALLTLYRDPFLHGLLPLANWTRGLVNFAVMLLLGLTAAAFPVAQRRGKRFPPILPAALWTVLLFSQRIEYGYRGTLLLSGVLIVTLVALSQVFSKEVSYDG